jgi:transcriptional regulator GlxA family with amidase domain
MSGSIPEERLQDHGLREVLLLVAEDFDLLDLAGPLQVLATANGARNAYRTVTASASGGPVAAACGLCVATRPLASARPARIDTLLVIGGARGGPRRALVDWLGRHGAAIRRVCGIGPGMDALGEAELIAPSDRALHWLASPAPPAEAKRAPIAVRRGSVWTCAGAAAAIDLSLALVAEDLGRPAALAVAEALAVPVWRHPAEPQVSATLALQVRLGAPFADLLRRMRADLAGDLRVETLADWCNMSPRTFARRFASETGTTPAAAAAALRLETAEALLDAGGATLKQVAGLCGFGSELSLRRALGRSPRSAQRRRRRG